MSASVFDHGWLSGLFSAPKIAPLWSTETQLAHLLAFERAWTEALAATGRVTPEAAAAALTALERAAPDPDALRAGTAQDGLVIPALVKALRDGLAAPEAIHTGATSQDVLDTALALTLRDVAGALCDDLDHLIIVLDHLNSTEGDNALMGRTRMQAALPMKAGRRIAGWVTPLRDLRAEASRRTIPAQIGGAVGDNQALGDEAAAITNFVAQRLDLAVPASCWHADRNRIADYAGWLARITAAIGKIGRDITLMAQQGIDEIALTGGGGSSAMPHKQNPVHAELLVTLADYNAAQSGLMVQAMLHEQERSGIAWALEWMVLPPMTMATGCATHTALTLLRKVTRIGVKSGLGGSAGPG